MADVFTRAMTVEGVAATRRAERDHGERTGKKEAHESAKDTG